MRSNIKIDMSPVSGAYLTSPDEKQVEFSAYRKDVNEDGSYNTLLGGLMTFRVVRANGGDVPEDKLIIDVYNTDPNVEVRWRSEHFPRCVICGARLVMGIRAYVHAENYDHEEFSDHDPALSAVLVIREKP